MNTEHHMARMDKPADPPLWCLVCRVSSEGGTYLAFIGEHANCVLPSGEGGAS